MSLKPSSTYFCLLTRHRPKVVSTLDFLEEHMIPAGYKTPIPDLYNDMELLQGRATVEMKLVKADKSNDEIGGEAYTETKLTMDIDGYVGPVTSGNFIDLVKRGFYNGTEIQRSDGFVAQAGDPAGDADGFVGTVSKDVGNGKHGARLVPFDIFIKDDKGLVYESTIADDGHGGQAMVLPFSIYGAMSWAREKYEVKTGSSLFFLLHFDSDLTPAGKNVLDGRYPCLGYVVDGADLLADIKEGGVILSATVTKGLENLVLPK